jgi:hypothetical protein
VPSTATRYAAIAKPESLAKILARQAKQAKHDLPAQFSRRWPDWKKISERHSKSRLKDQRVKNSFGAPMCNTRDLLMGRVDVDECYIGGLEEGLPGRLNLEKHWLWLPLKKMDRGSVGFACARL